MFGMNRVKRMFTGSRAYTGDSTFETYYGSILRDRQEGGPSAQEARRDFEGIRQTISRIGVY